ncbi:MAG TPA: DUF1653 domain-containing protein [Oscillospiraceae bacterium]|nr:DUF1653 domain-containing protein [Oscillospiraceae bacterium]
MTNWINESVFYHIYPLGFCGAPMLNTGTTPVNRIKKVIDWIPHLKEMNINAVYFGPVFESTVHGYDTSDYRKIDKRLGTNEDFKQVCDELHKNNIRVILDGVFNHTGRDFWAFKDLQQNEKDSEYAGWFSGVNFQGTSPYNDQFSYEGWNGHYNLVKLNLKNPMLVNYLLETVKLWIDEFKIDGLRLDAADCVDFDFWRQLHNYTKNIKNDFWLMGEIIHGDYRRWANSEMLDSVTNYECHKGIYSSHNDKNYFEIAHSLNRQFGTEKLYKNLTLYSFVDNHDVNRIGSLLKNQYHIYNVYTLMYCMPGVPSIYYGSEWGIKGEKANGSDNDLRPCLNLDSIPDKNDKLFEHICKLGKIRTSLSALEYGEYEQIIVKNQQLVFKRFTSDQTVYIALNLSDSQETLSFRINTACAVDMLENKEYSADNGNLSIIVPPCSSMILTEKNSVSEKPEIKEQKSGVTIGGKYRHFKGNTYTVISVGQHSETLEEMVVYQGDDKHVWIRPLIMFTDEVNDHGNIKRRFEPIN